ncbi:TMF family protein [Flagellimonas sp. CMM7]|uniref:TMF family protein n=1 Tax=Flagellimonas sp. CMM7 TaxID=2654676 RepID=UPI0013D8548A|nr:TMF family protein [Flagellimonas sp. CMM7]UII79150.1 TMF family protein [Flagellimonas sp. CMM7]
MKKTIIFPSSVFFLFSIFTFGQNSFPASGNVGIGTLTPGYDLEVIGSINATQLLVNGTPIEGPVWSLNGNDSFYNAGNVGIGTNTPGFTLDVNGSLNANSILLNGSAVQSSQWTTTGNDVSYSSGNVGIGIATVPAGYALAVVGSVITEGVTVKLQSDGWPDFVFKDDYLLPSLESIEDYIQNNGHLPNIPSALEIGRNGIHLGEMDAQLLQKIEELTLYTIQQQKEIDKLKNANQVLTEQNELVKTLTQRIEKMEKSLKK